MRRAFAIVIFLAAAVIAVTLIAGWSMREEPEQLPFLDTELSPGESANVAPVSVVAEGLNIPWDIAFLPEGEGMLVTERGGRVLHLENGETHVIEGVVHTGEAGLLGIALHPDFAQNRHVYLYLTTSVAGQLVNNIVRYIYRDEALTFDRVIFDNIPASRTHDGGRIEFGPDGLLYATVGDAGNEPAAQDTNSLAGKILRITADGGIPEDNPFGNAVYSYGHRNPQGLTWDAQGRLFSTEHGRSGSATGYDEVNAIERAANYGWPNSEGDTVAEGTVAPLWHSGATNTWAPASAVYYEGSIFFGGLRGAALYEAVLDNGRVTDVREHFKGEFGRIRTVRVSPDGFLYLTTSNRDGRGRAQEGDDKIIRIDPAAL